MSSVDILFLTLLLLMFASFATALAFYSQRSRRLPEPKAQAQAAAEPRAQQRAPVKPNSVPVEKIRKVA